MDQPNINPSEQNINKEPVISPNPSNLPNKSNSFPKIFLFILLFVAFLGGGILLGKYLYSPQTPITAIPTLTPTTIPKIDPTANWQIITNEEHGYTLKYPNSWIYFESNKAQNELNRTCFSKNNKECPLFISVLEKSSWEKEKELLGLAIGGNTEEVVFAGVKGLKRTGGLSEKIDQYGPTEEAIILINNNNKVYKIWAIKKSKNQENYTIILDEILSTFKFTQ